jgi:hypothetical protein
LAASEDLAASWPIGLLSRALHLSGRPIEGQAVHSVVHGCRVTRFQDMATNALAVLEQKLAAPAATELPVPKSVPRSA